jgi:hypothetical protein
LSLAKVGDFGVDWLDLVRPFSGNWIARARLDIGTDAAPALGASSIVFDTGAATMTYSGTIIDSSDDEGDAWIVMVGGAGGLRIELDGDDYERPPPRVVVSAILSAAGEVEGDLAGLASLPRVEPFYGRLAGRADRQLDALCSVVSARWYVTHEGKVSVGPATWPTYPADAFIVHRPNAQGVVSAEPDLPDVEPGMVVDGYRIAHVRYFVTEDGLSARLTVEAT